MDKPLLFNWEQFEHMASNLRSKFMIYKTGNGFFNAEAMTRMFQSKQFKEEHPTAASPPPYPHIILYYDTTKKTIGFKPTDSGATPGATPVTISNPDKPQAARLYKLPLSTFLEHHFIVIHKPLHLPLEQDQQSGLYYVKLPAAGRKRKRAGNHKRYPKKKKPE